MPSSLIGEIADSIRAALPRQQEWLMMNDVPPPTAILSIADAPDTYIDLLSIADGLICGPFVLFDSKTVASMQSYVDLPEGAAVGLSPADWFCAGTVNDEPWFIRRIDGSIWLFPDTGVIWWMSSRFEKVSDDLEAFLTDVVWGPRYPSLTGASDDDQWYELLQEIGRVE